MMISRKRKGFALVFSLVVVLLIILVCTAYFSVATNDLLLANRVADSTRAYYLAEAGLADAFMRLRADLGTPASISASELNYPVGPGNLTGSYVANCVSDGAAWPTYTITSTGTYHGVIKNLVLQVRMISFSRWDYVSNSEIWFGWPLWWVTGMVTTGPVFTNGQFNFFGTPVFDGPVGQVNSSINYFHTTSNPQNNPSGVLPLQDNPSFRYGVTLSAPSMDAFAFPNAALDRIRLEATNQGLLLTGVSWITLLANGTMNITNQNNGWVDHNVPIPVNTAVFVQGDVLVQGPFVNGQLTIGSDNNLWIGGSLLYHDKADPDRTIYAGGDLLGLVARNNIVINFQAPGNIEIDAYLVALLGSFQASGYWVEFKGNMIQFGGLANQICGPTGVMDWSGNVIAGYNQLQYYDTRLEHMVPPWFPAVR
ncbi:MAG: hypothetical protein Q8O01_07380, partial [Candidatus Omnitrophota bacterium]|nr:hypothetical protein [Candidatus Omnitrophota bacterium]